MYSPLQQHNPKRKMNDLATRKIKADHHLSNRLAGDYNGMQLMNIPKVPGPQSVNARQSKSMAEKQQFKSQRELPNRHAHHRQESLSYKPKNHGSMVPNLGPNAKKPNSYRGAYNSNSNDGALSRSPNNKLFSEKNDNQRKGLSPPKKGSLAQRQASAEPQNALALPSPFDNSAAHHQLAAQQQPGSHRRRADLKGSHPGAPTAPMLGPTALKNMKYNNTEDLNSQYSFVSAGPTSPQQHQGSHMKHQSLMRA